MVRNCRANRARVVSCLPLLLAATGVLVIASPRNAEASAFMISVLTSESSTGHSQSGSDSSVLSMGSANHGAQMPALALGTLPPPAGWSIASHRSGDQTNLNGWADVPTVVQTFGTGSGTQPADAAESTNIASLNLGKSDYLIVSGIVAQSLARDSGPNLIGRDSSDGSGTSSPQWPGPENGPAAAVNGAVLPDVANGIVSFPVGNTALSSASDATAPLSGIAAAAVPEPGSLLLFCSGLAVSAGYVRRRKRLPVRRDENGTD